MKQQITYELIKSLNPCYDPINIGMPTDYDDSIVNFITNYRNKVKNKKDIIWVLARHKFLNDKELRLYAIWCARQVQYLMKDERSIKVLEVAEAYVNGNATIEELNNAATAAYAATDAADAAAYAADAADAATDAADAADAAADAATDAADAAADADAAATDAADAAAYAAYAAAAAYAADAADAAAYAAYAATDAADAADAYATYAAAIDKQIDKLLEIFKEKENHAIRKI